MNFFKMQELEANHPPGDRAWAWSDRLDVLEHHLVTNLRTRVMMVWRRLESNNQGHHHSLLVRHFVLMGEAEVWTQADLQRAEACVQELVLQLHWIDQGAAESLSQEACAELILWIMIFDEVIATQKVIL